MIEFPQSRPLISVTNCLIQSPPLYEGIHLGQSRCDATHIGPMPYDEDADPCPDAPNAVCKCGEEMECSDMAAELLNTG